MTKSELAKRINEKTHCGRAVTLAIMEECFLVIKECMAEGEDVFLRGFGTFYHRKVVARASKGAAKQWVDSHPEATRPAFRPCEEFIEMIKAAKE